MNLQRLTEAQHQLARAQFLLEANLPEQARRHLWRSIELDPDLAEARVILAKTHLDQGKSFDSLSALELHDQDHPDERERPGVAMLRVRVLIRCGLDDQAHDLLERLTAEYPDDVRVHRLMAGLCLKTDRNQTAIQRLRDVIRLEPSDRCARTVLAQLLQSRTPQDAVEVLLDDPNSRTNPERKLWTAVLLQRTGRDREAEDLLEQLLVARPDDPQVWLRAGALADRMGADTLAVKRLERAVALDGGYAGRAMATLAIAHMHAGRLEPAGWWWWRMLRHHSDAPQAWAGLMVCAMAAGKNRLARRAQRVLSRHTSRHERQTTLAELWNHVAAGLVIRHASRPSEPERVGHQSSLQGLLHESVRALETTAQAWPDRADTHYHLATCLRAMGQTTQASDAVRAALAINPEYRSAKRLSELIHQQRPSAA